MRVCVCFFRMCVCVCVRVCVRACACVRVCDLVLLLATVRGCRFPGPAQSAVLSALRKGKYEQEESSASSDDKEKLVVQPSLIDGLSFPVCVSLGSQALCVRFSLHLSLSAPSGVLLPVSPHPCYSQC